MAPVWSSRSCWEVTLTSEEECGSHIAGNSHLLCWGQHPRRALSIRGEAKRRRYISMIMEKIPRRKCRASSGPAPSSSPPSLCRTQVHCFHLSTRIRLFVYLSIPTSEGDFFNTLFQIAQLRPRSKRTCPRSHSLRALAGRTKPKSVRPQTP